MRLSTSFGVRDLVLRWFQSYAIDRVMTLTVLHDNANKQGDLWYAATQEPALATASTEKRTNKNLERRKK